MICRQWITATEIGVEFAGEKSFVLSIAEAKGLAATLGSKGLAGSEIAARLANLEIGGRFTLDWSDSKMLSLAWQF